MEKKNINTKSMDDSVGVTSTRNDKSDFDTAIKFLKENYKMHVPSITTGWEDDFSHNYAELMSLPTLLDQYQTQQIFKVPTGRPRVKSTPKRLASDYRKALQSMDHCTSLDKTKVVNDPGNLDIILKHFTVSKVRVIKLLEKEGYPKWLIEKSPISALGYTGYDYSSSILQGVSKTVDTPYPDWVISTVQGLILRRIENLKAQGELKKITSEVNLDDYLNVTASLPRGKNTGLPLMSFGSDRFANDVVMAVTSALACILIRGTVSYEDMFRGLCDQYICFSRWQHTFKKIPYQNSQGSFTSESFLGRKRDVNAVNKVLAFAIKPFAKFWSELQLHIPEFDQDRMSLIRRLHDDKASSVYCSDSSTFDKRSGGVKLRQALQVMLDISRKVFPNMPRTLDDLVIRESFLPTMLDVIHTDGSREFKTSNKSTLRSGSQLTSRVGSIMNICDDIIIQSSCLDTKEPEKLIDYYLTHSPTAVLGDDLIKFLPRHGDGESYEANSVALESVGKKASKESPLKFLGALIINPKSVTSLEDASNDEIPPSKRGLYYSCSPIINMFFPERFRKNMIPGLLARTVISTVADQMEGLKNMTRLMVDNQYFQDIKNRFLDRFFPDLNKHYSTHPNSAARQAWLYVVSNIGTCDIATFNAMVAEYPDEILDLIAHGTAFDFNYKLIGVSSSEAQILEDLATDEESVVRTSLSAMQLTGRDLYRKFLQKDEKVDQAYPRKDPNTDKNSSPTALLNQDARERFKVAQLEAIVRIFSSDNDVDFTNTWRGLLPQISREVKTSSGSIFVMNI